MTQITVKTVQKGADGAPDTPRQVSFEKDFGGSLASCIEEHGEELVLQYFEQQAILRTQGVVRTALKNGQSDAEAIAAGESYKLGQITRTGGTAGIKNLAKLVKSGKMDRDTLLAMLTEAMEEDEEGDE